MERKKTKLSIICVSVVVILSVVLAVFGVLNTNSLGQATNSAYANTKIDGSTVADSSKDNYMGGIDMNVNDYIARKNYQNDQSWVAISNAAQLKEFLIGSSATYSGKNGYLTANISDFNWDDMTSDAAYLAPRIVFSRQLDGCGYSITFNGSSTDIVTDAWSSDEGWTSWKGTKVIAEPDTNKAGAMINETTPGFINPSNYRSAAFGGLISILAGGALTNFKFVIDSSHRFIHDIGTITETYMTVGGGLVGYQTGGKIDNVVVELAANRQLGATHAEHGCGDRTDNTSINGLVVGAISGGAITNATAILQPGSMVASFASSLEASHKTAVSYAGGIVGFIKRCDKVANVTLYGNGGEVRAFSGHAQPKGVEDTAHEYAGGIAACINTGINIAGAKVVGNMNCLSSSDTVKSITKIKNIGVAKGAQPTPMLYVDATGGTNTEAITSGNINDRTRGYTDNKDKIILNTQNNVALYFDKATDGAVRLFIPQNNIVWSIFGERKVSDLITGASYDKLVFEVPEPDKISEDSNGDRITSIELGTSGSGEVGIYKRDLNGADMEAAFDGNGNLTTGTRWTEMSDQARAEKAGVTLENAPALYYDGTTYVVKIKIGIYDSGGNLQQRLFSDKGLNIRNIGDLKNAQSSFNGRPVKLYCDSDVAYIDEQRKIIIMVDNLKEGDMQKQLTIQKRSLWVNIDQDYERGKTTIFEGTTISFDKVDNDPNTGLVVKTDDVSGNVVVQDYIMWQDTRYNEGAIIELNVAGRQMLRPSTNNYIIKHRVYWGGGYYDEDLGSYFSAHIVPHEIKVDSGIYINGAAITNGVYEVKNARTDNPAYNETKRKIVVTARVNDSHFTAKRVVFKDAAGNEVTKYLDSIGGNEQNIVWKKADGTVVSGNDWRSITGLVTAELYINDGTIKSIEFEDWDETFYTVSVNDGKTTTTKDTYRYGDRVYLNAASAESGMAFVGWQREKDNSFVSYQPNYSLKVTENFNITAIYEPVAGKEWTHRYYGRYGRLQRTAVASNEQPIADYRLPVTMGWEFKSWEATVDYTNKTVEFNAVFAKRSENPSITYPKEPTVNVTLIPSSSDFVTEYGTPIKLEANKTYLVNGAEVVVGDEDMVIYAIVDLTIEEIDPDNQLIKKEEASMNYNSFVWNNGTDNDNKNVYYINITFVYGDENAYYGDDDRPEISMDGFTDNDYTEYNRFGNVYQLIMVITAQELECRFGNDSEIATFLTVDGYTYDNILIFRRHSSDTSTM